MPALVREMATFRELLALLDPYSFVWVKGVTIASRLEVVVFGIAAYLVTVFGLKAALGGKAIRVPTVFPAIHNLILCGGSAIMFLGCGYEAVLVSRSQATALSKQNARMLHVCLPPNQ